MTAKSPTLPEQNLPKYDPVTARPEDSTLSRKVHAKTPYNIETGKHSSYSQMQVTPCTSYTNHFQHLQHNAAPTGVHLYLRAKTQSCLNAHHSNAMSDINPLNNYIVAAQSMLEAVVGDALRARCRLAIGSRKCSRASASKFSRPGGVLGGINVEGHSLGLNNLMRRCQYSGLLVSDYCCPPDYYYLSHSMWLSIHILSRSGFEGLSAWWRFHHFS